MGRAYCTNPHPPSNPHPSPPTPPPIPIPHPPTPPIPTPPTPKDALDRVHGSVKPSYKAALLAGGIASLLHLFASLLRTLNNQLASLITLQAYRENIERI